MRGKHFFNLYFELPGAGGGNEKFKTLDSAIREFDSMTSSYPDVFAQVTEWFPDGSFRTALQTRKH